jgi:putative FmdB family regulatory protein
LPIYEYECLNCGARFELLRGISDSDRSIKCPKCGKEKVRRVFSTFATPGSSSCAPRSPT